MAIHTGARDLETEMRYRVTKTIRGRGGSDANTRLALRAVGGLVYAVPGPVADDAARRVAQWAENIRTVGDIDQAHRWTPLPQAPGCDPPPCPYCDLFSLRMSRTAYLVRCINSACVDDRDRRPVARMMAGGLTGDAYLAFGDGREVVYQ